MKALKFPVITCIGDIVKYIEIDDYVDEDFAFYQAQAEFEYQYPDVGTCEQCGDMNLRLGETDCG